jgi:hypothetical protein
MQDPTDRALFFYSIYIHIGDGKNTPFWEARWLHGAVLKDIAPKLYERARIQGRMVYIEMKIFN